MAAPFQTFLRPPYERIAREPSAADYNGSYAGTAGCAVRKGTQKGTRRGEGNRHESCLCPA